MSGPPVARWGAPVRRGPRSAPASSLAPAPTAVAATTAAATSLAFEDPHADVARLIERRLARNSTSDGSEDA